jgi:tetratricopeptide (TPR) repeat protein
VVDVDRTVRRAQYRLWLNRWLRLLGWSATIAGAGYVLVVLPNKLLNLTDYGWFHPGAAAGAAGLAVVGSLVWLLATREDRRTAATALDLAAGLKERISSGLYCRASDDPFARAVFADARRVSRSVTPRRHLRLTYPRSASYAFGVSAVALIVTFLIPPMDLLGKQEEKQQAERKHQVVQRTEAVVRKTFDEVRKLADENPLLKKMEGLENLDPLTEAKADTAMDVRRDAIKKIDNLVRSVRDHPKMGNEQQLDAMKKMLRRASNLSQNQDSRTRELNKALASGDFKAAREALQKIAQDLSKEAKTPEDKARCEQMAKQLDNLAKRLEQAAQAQKLDKETREALEKSGADPNEVQKKLASMSEEDLKKLAEQLEKSGMSKQQAQQIAKQLQQKQQACRSCQGLGQGLSQLAQAAAGAASGAQSQGSNSGAAAAGMQMAGQQLSQMEQLEQQLNDLQAAMADLQDMKDGLGQSCPQCHGTGMYNGQPCSACGGSGMQGGLGGQGAGGQAGQGPGGGMGGLGVGRGGVAPEKATAFKMTPKKAPIFTEKGALIGQTWVDGEQIKGDAGAEFVETVLTAERDAAESIRKETMPRQYQHTTGRYFSRMAKEVGGAGDSAEAADKGDGNP